jgi:hypothetical protein
VYDPIGDWIALPFDISFMALNCIFLFRLWKLAQASDLKRKKPSPGKAVGFVFIPFYNFYWLFIQKRNLALHLNHLTTKNKVPVGLVTIGCALLCSILLYIVGGIILNIVYFSFYKSAKELIGRD